MSSNKRAFDTGATRDTDDEKLQFTRAFDVLVVTRFLEYMRDHNKMADGTRRREDNWKKGFPAESMLESDARHFLDKWLEHEKYQSRDGIEEALCGQMFNVMADLRRVLVERDYLSKK